MPQVPYTRIEHLRLLLILLVVLIHARPQRIMVAVPPPGSAVHFVCSTIVLGMSSVAVPMFALLSGFLFFFNLPFQADRYAVKIRRRLKTLAVPYLLCSAGNLALLFLLQNAAATRRFFTRDPDFILKNLGMQEIAELLFINPIPVQLWFLRDLIVLVVLSPIIGLAIRTFRWWSVLPFLSIWVVSRPTPPDERLIVASMTTAFFLGGACMATHAPSVIDAAPRWRGWLPFVWVAIAVVKGAGVLPVLPARIMGNLGVLVGIAALWCNADLLSLVFERPWLRWIAPTSFFIFLAHQPLLRVVERLAACVPLLARRSELFLVLAMPAVTILICAGTAVVMRCVSPRAYRLMTGDR